VDITRAGLSAPSSKNAQPWCLHVVADRATLQDIARGVRDAANSDTYVPVDPETGEPRPDWESTVRESAEVLRQVPLGIFVENRGEFSRGRRTLARATGETLSAALVGYTFEVVGLGAAIQNMWLASQARGLAGVFMGDILIAEQAIRQRLAMTGDLVGVLALGYTSAGPAIERVYEQGRVVWHNASTAHGGR